MEMNSILVNTGLKKYLKMAKGDKFKATESHGFHGARMEDETPTKECNGSSGDTMLLDRTRISEDLHAVKKQWVVATKSNDLFTFSSVHHFCPISSNLGPNSPRNQSYNQKDLKMAEAKEEVKLTVRFLILSQDAGGIIGKEGTNIKRIIEKSNAQVNITGTAGVERILNITGGLDEISTAVCLVAERLEEITGSASYGQNEHMPPVTIRLLVPNSQCGPLIGKGGSRIKEIREASGATITIPSENLLGCTERAVTLSGSPESLGICMEKICDIFLEFPPRNNNIKFIPSMGGFGAAPSQLSYMTNQFSLAGLSRRTQQKITLPSNVIGSLIGKGGCHINEVRRFSGANVQIEEAKGNGRRCTVTLSGAPEAVSAANFLINARIQAGRAAQTRNKMNARPRN